ncbi:hypothetical protein [Streptomyces sp. WM6386]|uniref:hypothetical protein n=1 Tax=Streptomyces sp. WM6386 TaxID=1415558 RepID=UPI000A5EF186|nr:hypothetical protein [Streptomyces sp. WM6386]
MSPRRGPEKPFRLTSGRTRLSLVTPEVSRGTKDDGRQAVLSALPPEPPVTFASGVQPGLQIRMTGVPVADWLCACGHHERARGKRAVIELTTRACVGHCPHRTTPRTEGRSAV